MLEIKGVSKGFGDKNILEGIHLTVNRGDIVGLLGKNGAGKTTLIKCINHLYQYKGEIKVSGIAYSQNPEQYLRKVGILLEPSYYDYMSAMENLRSYAALSGVPLKNIDGRLKELLDVIGLSNAMTKKVKEFSFGMKQKLGVAMALVKNPDVLVLDEPTIGVDPKGLDAMFSMIKTLAQKENIAIIFSSNNLKEVQDISRKIAFLKDGKIVDTVDTNEMLNLDNTYAIHVKHPIAEKIKDLISDAGKCLVDATTIQVENYESLNKILRIPLDCDNPIMDIERENKFLRNFYE